VAGDKILVAVPPAVVIVDPAVKTVVPDGANQIAFQAVPEETTVTAVLGVSEIEAAKTVF
jgi:hypothetical protein